MKKIGIVCYPTFGGSGIVASELGQALSVKHKIHFISYKKPVRFDSQNKNLFYHQVNVPDYPLFEYPPYELALTTCIVEVTEKYNLDLIHVHYAIPHAYAAINAKQILLEKSIKIPIVTTLHGTDITLVGKSPYIISAVNYAINQSSIVTAVSESLKKQTLKYFDIKKEIRVIPNFIDFQNSQLNLKPNNKQTRVITHISNFRPVKRVQDVVSIFYNIQRKINSKLILIGDGPDFKKIQKMVQTKGLDSIVQFLGKTKNIKDVLEKTDLFLLPSESESFGLVALEAMSFGVPVITTSSGGIVDLVVNNENGYHCPVGDVEAMSSNAIHLLTNSQLYQKMSSKSYQRAKEYDVCRVLPMYEDCYEAIV